MVQYGCMPKWRNRQTRCVQGAVGFMPMWVQLPPSAPAPAQGPAFLLAGVCTTANWEGNGLGWAEDPLFSRIRCSGDGGTTANWEGNGLGWAEDPLSSRIRCSGGVCTTANWEGDGLGWAEDPWFSQIRCSGGVCTTANWERSEWGRAGSSLFPHCCSPTLKSGGNHQSLTFGARCGKLGVEAKRWPSFGG